MISLWLLAANACCCWAEVPQVARGQTNEQGANFVAGKYLNAIQSTFNNINFINILTLGDSRVEGGRP